MPLLSYTSSGFPFVAFTKILSADANQCFNDIKTLLNTTGLDDTNLQAAGITRATKLKTGTANAVVINAPSTGVMSELAPVVSTAVYFNASGVPTAAALPLLAGGTGAALTLSNPDDVLRVNAGATAIELGAVPTPAPIKIFSFYNFG